MVEEPGGPTRGGKHGGRSDGSGVNLPRLRASTVVAMVAALVLVIVVAFVVLRTTTNASPGASGPEHSPTTATPATASPTQTAKPRPTFPSATTTGVPAGTPLSPVAGELRVTTAGAVLDALDISGPVVVAAPNVTITRSRIHGTGEAFGITVESGSVTITDSEISDFANGVGFDNWTAERVNIHNMTEDGVKLGSNVTLADSYIHDLTPGPGSHGDGAQMQAAVHDLVVRGNVIDVSAWNGEPGMNAAIFLKPDFGPSSAGPVQIVGNFLDGGGYVLYCTTGASSYTVASITISDNRFGRDSGYGPVAIDVPVTADGNVWDDSGRPLAF
jgi:hypothetical protein